MDEFFVVIDRMAQVEPPEMSPEEVAEYQRVRIVGGSEALRMMAAKE